MVLKRPVLYGPLTPEQDSDLENLNREIVAAVEKALGEPPAAGSDVYRAVDSLLSPIIERLLAERKAP